LSKATNLSSRLISGSFERIADIEASIRSASLGPPKREFRASGLKPRLEGGAASGSLAVVEEFSTLHFRSSLRPGSMVGCEVGRGIWVS